MSARKPDKTSKPAVRKPAKRAAAQGEAATTLPESMVTGRPGVPGRDEVAEAIPDRGLQVGQVSNKRLWVARRRRTFQNRSIGFNWGL
jgi:hypothetical protein